MLSETDYANYVQKKYDEQKEYVENFRPFVCVPQYIKMFTTQPIVGNKINDITMETDFGFYVRIFREECSKQEFVKYVNVDQKTTLILPLEGLNKGNKMLEMFLDLTEKKYNKRIRIKCLFELNLDNDEMLDKIYALLTKPPENNDKQYKKMESTKHVMKPLRNVYIDEMADDETADDESNDDDSETSLLK